MFKCVTVKDSAQCSSKIKHVQSMYGKWVQHDLSNNHKQEHGCLPLKCNSFEATPNFLQPIITYNESQFRYYNLESKVQSNA